MELRRIVWEWDSALARVGGEQPRLAVSLGRSCRPIAAERRAEGQLVLVLGCWWQPDLELLRAPRNSMLLNDVLSSALEDRLQALIEEWPAGMATAYDDESIRPPDVLEGLPLSARETAAACESTLQRHFFARAYREGIRPECQYEVLSYRVDFAFPSSHLGVEIDGWERPAAMRGRAIQREREQHLGMSGWRVLRFWGAEVLRDVAGCVADVRAALR